MLVHTHEAGGYLGNGAIDLVATLLGNSCLIPLLSLAFLLSRDLDLSIRAACILASFVALGARAQKTQPMAKQRPRPRGQFTTPALYLNTCDATSQFFYRFYRYSSYNALIITYYFRL